jgi:hypothetical protein
LLHKDGKPLVFIIDELDRCRPSFALELLERVKHFFAVPNVHFVLGAHLKQLENSVRVTYGSEIDAQLYLQKFISLHVELDTPGNYPPANSAISKYMSYLKEQMKIPDADDAIQSVTGYAVFANLSLRTAEKIMTTLAVMRALAPGSNHLAVLIAGLAEAYRDLAKPM